MARVRPYLSNAPIKEAVVDLRVSVPRDFDLRCFDSVPDMLKLGYVKVGPIVEIETSLSISADGEGKGRTDSRELGTRFHSADQKYVAQFSRHGFTFSRLAPYETWERLLGESKRLWEVYLECARAERVTRIATRFINELHLPMQPGEEFETYLSKPPDVPDALPQSVSAFLQRVVIHNVELDISANLTQILRLGTATDTVPIILDIDVFRSMECDPKGDEIWTCLERFREFKNLAFFESITEKTVELYL